MGYYSDCESFAGCEHMLKVLLGSALASDLVQAHFTYRYSREYVAGMREHLPPGVSTEAVLLPDLTAVRARASGALDGRMLWIFKAVTYALPLRQILQVVDVVCLWRVFRRHCFDVVHINNGGFPGAASCNPAVVAARLAKVPSVVYVANNLAEGYRHPWRWADYPLDRLTARCVDCFVTGSEAAAAALRRVLHLSEGQIVSIHNGIIPKTPGRSAEELRADLGVDPGAVLIVIVARLEKRKGHRYLVEALGKLATSPSPVLAHLVIEGAGPEEASLRDLVDALDIKGLVRFVGRVDNVWDVYEAADIVVLPSVDHEDFPNVVLEAMAARKPVVASALAGTTEQVIDGVTGLLVPPGDVEALAGALGALIRDEETRQVMGAAGRARFLDQFSAASAAARYWDLYQHLASPDREENRRRTMQLTPIVHVIR